MDAEPEHLLELISGPGQTHIQDLLELSETGSSGDGALDARRHRAELVLRARSPFGVFDELCGRRLRWSARSVEEAA